MNDQFIEEMFDNLKKRINIDENKSYTANSGESIASALISNKIYSINDKKLVIKELKKSKIQKKIFNKIV